MDRVYRLLISTSFDVTRVNVSEYTFLRRYKNTVDGDVAREVLTM